jgi:LysR family glycine cleavage system transcriptional activator
VSVAQHLNFTRAAESLGVTASAASLQIRALEEYLGRQLLRRDGRHVSLTEEGAELLPKVQRALEDLERALDDSRAERDSGVLRLSTLASFLQQWLAPRLTRFSAQHPGIHLNVHTSSEMVDFVRSGHHFALRLGGGGWPGVQAEKLMDEWLVPVCRAPLLSAHGPVDDASRLSRYPLLHSESEPWSMWINRSSDRRPAPPPAGSVFDDSRTILQSALRGEGLALSRWSLVADEIAAGNLVLAAREPLAFERGYWFVCPRQSRRLETVEQFRRWLFAEASRFPMPPGTASRG